MMKIKKKVACLLAFAMLTASFGQFAFTESMRDVHAETVKTSTEAAPVCDSTCHRYTVTGAPGGTYENGVLTVPSKTGALLTSDLPGTASAYYMSMTLKSAGNINLGYRATTGKYLLVNKSGYQAIGNGEWQASTAFANLASGVRITLYSSTTELKVWAGEEKILDEAYADSGNAKPGIQWSNDNEVTMSDICIWTEGDGTVPVYDGKQHVLHEVTGMTTGYPAKNVTYENSVLSVEAGADAYLTSDLPKDASYYASMTVKSDKVSISARNTGTNYFLLDAKTNSYKGQYHAPNVAGANWQNPTTAIFALMRNEGISITYYSTPDHLTVWVNGSKLIDGDYTGTKGNTTPGISWTWDSDATVSDIKIWTERPETAPVCDSTCHRYTVTGATNGTYENGVLTVSSGTNAFLTSDLPGTASAYYMSMTLKSAGDINLSYRATTGKYFQLKKSGYLAAGNGSWQNSAAFANLASGVKITLYSSTTELKVWAGEEKILDEAYADSGNAKPGIQWSNNHEVTMSDICIWTKGDGTVPVYDEKQHVLHEVTGMTTGYPAKNVTYENGVLSVEAGANGYLTSDLPKNASYYASMTVKSDKVSISARNTDKNYFLFDALTNSYKGQYYAPGIASANWVNPATAIFALMRNEGISITYYSAPDHLTVWVNGSKLIDGDYTGAKGNATPGISWAHKDTTVSDIKIWTEPGVYLNGNTATLDGSIGLNFYMDVDLLEAEKANEGTYMLFKVPNEEDQKVTLKELDSTAITANGYKFTCNVPAKKMTDTITAQFYVNGKAYSTAYTYSVAEYAKAIINDTTGAYSDEAKELAKAMLHYGAYSQQYFGYNTAKLANAGLSELDLSTVTADSFAALTANNVKSLSGLGSNKGSSLVLESETTLKLYFASAAGVFADDLQFTCGGKALKVSKISSNGETLICIPITNIAADKLGAAIEVLVSDSANSGTLKYSALTYGYNVLKNEAYNNRSDLQNLVKALYLYNQAAVAYGSQQ